ncbi:MAG: diguanylate cyclase, partial [Myxococcota bacterium]
MSGSLSRTVRRTLKVLIVEDDELDARLVARMLKRSRLHFVTHIVSDLKEATDQVYRARFDCALVSLELPDNGVVQFLRSAEMLRRGMPVIVMANTEHEDNGASAVGLGAQDYLIRGEFNQRYLIRAILYAIERKRMVRELEKTQSKLRETVAQLEAANARLSEKVRIDPLTRLSNRLALTDRLQQLIAEHRRGRIFTLVMVDIDHFKRFNDTYGHPEGDQLLVHFGEILTQALREVDLVSRYGGEEFALLLVDSDETATARVCERIRARIARTFADRSVTASFGVREYHRDLGPDMLFKQADSALYAAKRFGRNRVVAWSQTTANVSQTLVSPLTRPVA